MNLQQQLTQQQSLEINGFHNMIGPPSSEVLHQQVAKVDRIQNQISYAGFKGNLRSPNNKQLANSKAQTKISMSNDKRSLTEIRQSQLQRNQAVVQDQPFVSQTQPTPKQNFDKFTKKTPAAQAYQYQVTGAQQELVMRSNSSFEKEQPRTANNQQAFYKGVLGPYNKSRESNKQGATQFIVDQNYKLPSIQQQTTINGNGGVRILHSPNSLSQKDHYLQKHVAANTSINKVSHMDSQDEQRRLSYQKYSNQNNTALNQRKISQSNSTQNVVMNTRQMNEPQLVGSVPKEYPMSFERTNRVTSDKSLVYNEQFLQQVNNSGFSGYGTTTDMSSGNGQLGIKSEMQEQYQEDFDEVDAGGGGENDEDFKEGAGMFLDQQPGDGYNYDDGEEPEEEDDDVVNDDDDIVMEEDEEDPQARQTQQSNKTNKSDSSGMKAASAIETNEQREIRIKKKKTLSKRKSIIRAKKQPYNEGAEENKNWLAESQTTFSQEALQTQIKDVAANQVINTYASQMQDFKKPEIPTDGSKPKLKQLFLQRPPNNQIVLLKSQFNKRPPTIFFPYPNFLKMQRKYEGTEDRLVKMVQDDLKPNSFLGFKINDSTHTYNCVVNSFKTSGFRLVSGAAWNCLWTGLIKASKLKNINQYQKINHFPGAWHLGRKDNLWRNVFRMKRTHGQDYNIAPPTYIFPEDYKRWINEREAEGYKHMYIMKPTASSCGRGIKVIGKKTHVNKRSGYLVSKYLSKPHLLRGFKYDLRIYVLVTCFDPLRIYLFEEGLVRMATQQYSTGKSTLAKRFVHLTNFSVNKKAQNYVPNQNNNIEQAGDEVPNSSKWCLKQLRQEYVKMGLDFNQIFDRIKDVIIKTIIAVEPHIVTNMKATKHRNACFELYGFDIILDEKLKPWLLEVNVCPSLSSSSPLDKQIKTMLLSDVLHLIGLQVYDRKKHEKEQERINKQRLLGFDSKKTANLDRAPQQPHVSQSIISSPGKAEKHFFGSVHSSPERNRRLAEFVEGLNEEDYDMIADLEEENARKGHFNRIYPLVSNVDTYSKFFETQRHGNQVLWNYLKNGSPVHIIRNHFK